MSASHAPLYNQTSQPLTQSHPHIVKTNYSSKSLQMSLITTLTLFLSGNRIGHWATYMITLTCSMTRTQK